MKHPPSQLWIRVFLAAALLAAMPVSAELNPVWQKLYGAELLDPAGDKDEDGSSNQMESVAGTNPNDPTDFLAVSSVKIHTNGILLRWNSIAERNYSVEYRADSGSEWASVHNTNSGLGGQQEILLPNQVPGLGEYRLTIEPLNTVEETMRQEMADQDIDEDGQPDLTEYLAGTNPFDPLSIFGISDTLPGPFIKLEWSGLEGKAYQIQCSTDLATASWTDLGGMRTGGDGEMHAIFTLAEIPGKFFRIKVSDLTSGVDGLTQWDAVSMGIDPITLNKYKNNGTDIASLLALPTFVEIETPEPVANVTRNGVGMVEVRRTQGADEVILPFTVSGTAVPGTDYQALPTQIVLPFGAQTASLEIIPLAGYVGTATKSVILTFQVPTESGPVAKVVTVNLIRESTISVADYGAVGDGVTDDTAAIQAAIVALENTPSKNTLWFPAGSYRLSTLTSQTLASGSNYRILFLGSTDLAGRDLVFAGESGAVLLSKTGSIRSNILLTRARWRSLSFSNLAIEKDSQPLNLAGSSTEPNGAYGVAVVAWYGQVVEKLGFQDCTFNNCHGAVRTFSSGSDIWGNLKQFSMTNCQVLNPYGSNTIQGAAVYGGGQQVNVNRWVGNATYEHNLFVGGPDVVTDYSLNPDGVPKDGSHFGSPLRLSFENNIVRNMGVEAVFPTSEPIVARIATQFQIPPANTGQTVSVSLINKTPDTISSLNPGDLFNIRAWVDGGNRNCVMTVRDVNQNSTVITLENLGLSSEPIDGFTIPYNSAVYALNVPPCEATIVNNVIVSNNGRSGMGIASNSKAYIAHNFIQNYGVGINFYPEVRDILGHPERGSLAENNIIIWNPSETSQYFSYGVQSWGAEITVRRNFIQANQGVKCFGIVTRGDSDRILDNFVSIKDPRVNGYDSLSRSVGIGIGNTATNSFSSGNISRGFDVGMGPAQAYQMIPYTLNGHSSFSDILAIDPRGLTP